MRGKERRKNPIRCIEMHLLESEKKRHADENNKKKIFEIIIIPSVYLIDGSTCSESVKSMKIKYEESDLPNGQCVILFR